ncbi:MAG: sterol desaturase family protein [Neptuniibacter sp.]
MDWSNWLFQHEVQVRLGCFIGVFCLMAVWEAIKPCRQLHYSRVLRWSNNLALVALNSLILRLLFPAAAVSVAHYAHTNQWGLLNYIGLPELFEVILAVILLDLLIYWQHVLFHKVPLLWRLHRVHHVDPDYDVTTGIRFHPIEIVLSMLLKFAAVLLLGPSAAAVLIFEVVLNGSAVFNHANVRLPALSDKVVRWVLVTPDMHRVHHSWIRSETDSNYGFALSCWDRIFSTYQEQPAKGHQNMDIGLAEFTDVKQISWLTGILKIPFRR